MLDNFVLSIVSGWDIFEHMLLIYSGAPLCSAFPIRVWLDNYITGWWAGPWGPTEWPYCVFVCGFGPWTLDKPEQQIRDIFASVSVDFVSWVCKILEPLLKSHHNGREWALKSCSNCRKIIFHYELQSFNVMCLLYSHFAKDLVLKALSLFSFILRVLLQVSCWVELCSVFEECAFFWLKVSIRSRLVRVISNN